MLAAIALLAAIVSRQDLPLSRLPTTDPATHPLSGTSSPLLPPPPLPLPLLSEQELIRDFMFRPRDFMPLHLAHYENQCRLLLRDEGAMAQLRGAAPDVLIGDNTFVCSFLLAGRCA